MVILCLTIYVAENVENQPLCLYNKKNDCFFLLNLHHVLFENTIGWKGAILQLYAKEVEQIILPKKNSAIRTSDKTVS